MSKPYIIQWSVFGNKEIHGAESGQEALEIFYDLYDEGELDLYDNDGLDYDVE